jgi:hypothetical protein
MSLNDLKAQDQFTTDEIAQLTRRTVGTIRNRACIKQIKRNKNGMFSRSAAEKLGVVLS